jgi:hypothetical protein
MKNSVENTEPIFQRNEKPFGKGWEDWTVLWWKWLFSIPKHKNPAYDNTGDNFYLNQNDPNVIFLTGTFKDFRGIAERHCTIPGNRSILLPIINYSACLSDEHIKDEYHLHSEVQSNIDDLTRCNAFIDGKRINIKPYRVQSPIFEFNFKEDNVAGVKAGLTKVLSDGYWLFLRPLDIGLHNIQIGGTCQAGSTNIDAIYHLTIK